MNSSKYSLAYRAPAQTEFAGVDHDLGLQFLDLSPLSCPFHLLPKLDPVADTHISVSRNEVFQALQGLETACQTALQGALAIVP